MKIIIIGGGAVGTALAKKLAFEKHDLTIIDKDPGVTRVVGETLDVAVITGSGSHINVLERAGIADADMLIAASGTDEVNLVACMLANHAGVRHKIARIRDPEFYTSGSAERTKTEFGINLFIRPESEVADEVARLILRSFASEVFEFENGSLLIACLKVDESFQQAGVPIRQIGNEDFRRKLRLLAIRRPDKTIIPGGDDSIRHKDLIFLATESRHLSKILSFFGKTDTKLRRIMILGANIIGMEIAERLCAVGLKVKLIDRNRPACLEAAARLPDVDVLHSEKSEIDTMALAGVLETDAFIAVSDDEENNILLNLIARHLGVNRTIALVSRSSYQPFMGSIGIDTSINLQQATANAIVRFVRKGEIVSVASFHGIEAEAIEMALPTGSALVGTMLKDAGIPQGAVLAAIVRNGKARIPVGETVFAEGDKAIVFALPRAIPEIERLFT